MQEDLIKFSINYLQENKASYAEARLIEVNGHSFILKNGILQASSIESISGIGIRFLINNTQGFLSTNILNKNSLKKVINGSINLTKSSSKIGEKITFTKESAHKKKYKVSQKIKLQNLSPIEKIKLLQDTYKSLQQSKVKIPNSFLSLSDNTTHQLFLNSEGSRIESEVPRILFNHIITVLANNKSSQRYWEQSGSGGYEMTKAWNMHESLANEAKALEKNLKQGVKVKKGKQNLVVSPEITGIMVHESAGHPTEADRIYGREAAQAGESFVEKNSVGKRIGSNQVTIVDDPTIKNSAGFYLFDDEGVKARRKYLYKNGLITEFLHNRETASHMKLKSNGSSRSCSFDREPIVRMSNTFVIPSKTSEQELIKEAKNGIYLKSYTEWNIDDKRMNQKYVGAEAYLIENGEITKPVFHPTLEITTPRLWSSVNLVANNLSYSSGQCGKGDPMQGIPVWFGGPSMLIKNVHIY